MTWGRSSFQVFGFVVYNSLNIIAAGRRLGCEGSFSRVPSPEMIARTLIAAATLGAVLAIAPAGGELVGDTDCSTWYESTAHGPAFRNVRDWGATGDGVTDDTAAIYGALTEGRTSNFSTKFPAVVYLPPGTYAVCGSLPLWFYTHFVGNFRCRPTLLLTAGCNLNGYVLSADLSDSGDHDNEFYRAVHHVNIVVGPGNPNAGGIHWSVSQATHLRNVTIDLTASGHFGVFMENGSGGFVGDLTVLGGEVGLAVGNQQWTWRDVTVRGPSSACVNVFWNWVWAFLGLSIADCPVGIDFQGGAAGSLMLLDSSAVNVSTAVLTDFPNATGTGNLLLERFAGTQVPLVTAGVPGSATGTVFIPALRQGPYLLDGQLQSGVQSTLPLTRPDAPLERRARPTFGTGNGSAGVANVYSYGATGNGETDDTAALQAAITANAQVFLPAGSYLVSAPLQLRADSVLVGEVMSTLLAKGGAAAWADASSPAPLLAVPAGSSVRLADLLFAATGDVPGCVFVDWEAGPAGGVWDTHWRLEHTAHTLLRVGGSSPASAGGYFENMWGWVADHDIDSGEGLNVTNPNGFVVASTQPSWWYGTAAEHSYRAQYNLTGAAQVTTVVTQTESPYWQQPPSAWAMLAANATGLQLYGAGFYNWFNGNQSALFSVTNVSDSNAFAINTHGAEIVLEQAGGEGPNIPAYAAPYENWFCSGFVVYVGL